MKSASDRWLTEAGATRDEAETSLVKWGRTGWRQEGRIWGWSKQRQRDHDKILSKVE